MVSYRNADRLERETQALFLARAGVEAVMAAWLEEPLANKPSGAIDRIYCSSDGSFHIEEPDDYVGYVDVLVTQIEDPGGERHALTQIEATAVVQGVTRTARATTFPFLYGHDDSLQWYDEDRSVRTGTPAGYRTCDMSSQNSIHFQKRDYPPIGARFSAPLILFESPLDFSHDQEVTYLFFEDWITSSTIAYTLPILAEVIYFDDLVLLTLPKGSGYFSLDYRVVLQLPDPVHGGKRQRRAGGDLNARYGRFTRCSNVGSKLGGKRVVVCVHKEVQRIGAAMQLFDGGFTGASASYFRHGTILPDIEPKDKDLIRIPPDESRAIDWRDYPPFFWE